MIITEGIETALTIHSEINIPVQIWAAVSASGMKNVIIPPCLKRVIIAADNDENNVGQNAAKALKTRLRSEGREAIILMPRNVNTDFADALLGGAK